MTKPHPSPVRPSPRALARLLPLLTPYRGRLVVAFVFLVVAAAAGLVFPGVLRYLLDAAFEQRDGEALDRIALGLLGVFAVQAVANYVQVFLLSSSVERIVATLRERTLPSMISQRPPRTRNRAPNLPNAVALAAT